MSFALTRSVNEGNDVHNRPEAAQEIALQREANSLGVNSLLMILSASSLPMALPWINDMADPPGSRPRIPLRSSHGYNTTGSFRKKMLRYFNESIYHRREPVETVNSVMKRLLGSSVQSRSLASQCVEVTLMCMIYNAYRKVVIGFHVWFLHGQRFRKLKYQLHQIVNGRKSTLCRRCCRGRVLAIRHISTPRSGSASPGSPACGSAALTDQRGTEAPEEERVSEMGHRRGGQSQK
jgi:hypothetical protein